MTDQLFEFDDDYISTEEAKIRSAQLEEELSNQEIEFLDRLEEMETATAATVNDVNDVNIDGDTNVKDQNLTPPENFSLVCGKIYRSSFPKEENFQFLSKLNLKSILCLISEEYPEDNKNFVSNEKITFHQIGLSGNKEPFVKIKANLIEDALKIVLNPENQPILIHCNRGKHRTGCLIGCIRKLQKWSLSMIFDEYRKFSYPKQRPLDQQFIEMFDDDEINEYLVSQDWLPIKW